MTLDGPIIDSGRLADCLGEVTVVHVDTSSGDVDSVSGFEQRRLAGARFVSFDDALAGPAGPIVGRHPLPTPHDFAAALGTAGVPAGRPVVAYDDHNGAWAARLVWMLRIIGQPAALLDGGLAGWSGATESGPAHVEAPVDRPVVEWPSDATATADDVAAHLASGGVVIDSRAAERYRGEVEPLDNVAGHVPGAINLAFTENLTDGNLFVSLAGLKDRFAVIGADTAPIVYCGSGVTACHNALAIEAARSTLPRVYVGSWSGWSTDPARPIAIGH